MKLTTLFLIAFCLQLSARSFSQAVKLDVKAAPLSKVFDAIEKQTGYVFFYDGSILRDAKPVTLTLASNELEPVLQKLFADQPLSFSISQKTINVFRKTEKPATKSEHTEITTPAPPPTVHGRITNEKGEPVAGVNVSIKGGKVIGVTNDNGEFTLTNLPDNAVLVFSAVSVETFETKLNGRNELAFTMKAKVSVLDEVQMIAYGTTTKRLNTGSVVTVKSEDIEKQAVSNPLATLQGRVPGMVITQSKGLPGAGFKVQIRGQNSIAQGSDPLFIVDGVPFAAGNQVLNNPSVTSALKISGASGASPLNSLSPSDIESIEILKDADATAIYGSRGANGVVLITTKKGKAGKSKFDFSVYSGVSVAPQFMTLMNSQQYVAMRREAMVNDGVALTTANSPDVLIYDTTKYTDFAKLFLGGSASMTDVQTSVSGGTGGTQYLIGGNYHRESTIFPTDLRDNKGSFHFSINHTSPDQKFKVSLTGLYSSERNNLTAQDYANTLSFSPDLPDFYDSLGNLNWKKGSVYFSPNPFASLKVTNTANTDNLTSNLQLSYKLFDGLTLRTSMGYNSFLFKEYYQNPIAAQSPQFVSTASFNTATNNFKSWIIEPQVSYIKNVWKGKLDLLVGGTWQELVNDGTFTGGSGITSDALLGSLAAATTITARNSYSKYHYTAFFGRLNYNINNEYILNLTGRRDGSSRFGPDKQFGNFGAAGAAWIFSNRPAVQKQFSWLSFGKLRVSYGITGNDQIGDYNYLDGWASTTRPYSTGAGLYPIQLFNPDYAWEINKKFEAALELGFLSDRILLTAGYFNNRSSNQLINYRQPSQTGFTSVVVKNFPAVVQNSGVEFTLQTKPILTKGFSWVNVLTFSAANNKLVSFPGLATSSYANTLTEGESVLRVQGYHYTGVDPATGVFTVEDLNKDNVINNKDFIVLGALAPKFYGGFSNTFTYKSWQLNVFMDFRKQMGYSYLRYIYNNYIPGNAFNQPIALLDRWQKPGDNATFQRYTATFGTPAYNATSYFASSDATWVDASFIKIRTIALSYSLPEQLLHKMHLSAMSIYLQGQNLFTITGYKGADPEIQNPYVTPTLKTYTAGIRLTL